MKRSAIKRRRELLPEEQDDIAVYYAYADDAKHDRCEIAKWLGITWTLNGIASVWEPGYGAPAEQGAHHIWSVSGQRLHERSNLIRISHNAHWLVHNGTHGEPQTIRLCCVAAKLEKRAALNDPAEFDLEVMKRVAGRSISGWLAGRVVSEPWLKAIHKKAVWRVEEIERERGAA